MDIRRINEIYAAITAEQDRSAIEGQNFEHIIIPPIVRSSNNTYEPPTYPDLIEMPAGSPNNQTRQMVSFNHIIEHGEVPAYGTGHEWNISVDLNTDPPDAYNQNLNTLEENVLERIDNPAEDDAAGQRLKELLEQEEPWSLEDRRDWEENLSQVVSEEAAKLPGFDQYRIENRDPGVTRTGSANSLSEDIENGTYNIEYDCEFMSVTEGIVLQRVENRLLPEKSTGPDDYRYRGQYYYSTGSRHQGVADPDVGAHAYIVSSVTGNIIEGTKVNKPYITNSDPNWTFEDTINDKPFVGEDGQVYSRHVMSMEGVINVRLQDGQYDDVFETMNHDWVNIPETYLPEDYQMSDNMRHMLNIERRIDALENDPRYGPEYMPAAKKEELLQELYDERDAHIMRMALNGTLGEFFDETQILQNAQSEFDAQKASITSRLDTRWVDNLDEYARSDGGRFGALTGLPEGYEMSADMAYILERQRIIDDENSTPREREIAEHEIDMRLNYMIENGTIDAFESEMIILRDAQLRLNPPMLTSNYNSSAGQNNNQGENTIESAPQSEVHQDFIQTHSEMVTINPEAITDLSIEQLRGSISELDFNQIGVTDVSPALQNIIDQINEIQNYDEALVADPSNAGLLIGRDTAIDSFNGHIAHLIEMDEIAPIHAEINSLTISQATQRLELNTINTEKDLGTSNSSNIIENSL